MQGSQRSIIIHHEMELSDDDIQEFLRIYQAEFNESLTIDKGREMAKELLGLYAVLTEPLLGGPGGESVKDLRPANKLIRIVEDIKRPTRRNTIKGSNSTSLGNGMVRTLRKKKPGK